MRLFMTLVAVAYVAAVGDFLILGRVNLVWWVSVGFAAYMANQLMLVNLMPRGHGVTNRRHVLGMPIGVFTLYLVFLAMVLWVALTNAPELLPVTNANFKVLGFALLCGWLGGVADWYAFASGATHYFSEYKERMRAKAMGYSSKEEERYIANLRERGYLSEKK